MGREAVAALPPMLPVTVNGITGWGRTEHAAAPVPCSRTAAGTAGGAALSCAWPSYGQGKKGSHRGGWRHRVLGRAARAAGEGL